MTKDLMPADDHRGDDLHGYDAFLASQERRRYFGLRVRELRLRSKKRAIKTWSTKRQADDTRYRTEHLTLLDVWELLNNTYDWVGDVTQIRRIEKGEAQIDALLAEKLARILQADDIDSALLSHAAAGPGVAELLFKFLNLRPILIACMREADRALSGEITDEEFGDIIRTHALSIVLEIDRCSQLLRTKLEQLRFPPRENDIR